MTHPPNAAVARQGGALVSVSRFSLRKQYDPAQFDAVSKTLDAVAARLAKAAGSTLSESTTTTIADHKVRAYRYGGKRIAFVLEGRAEYQLFCSQTGAACDLLFSTFTLT